MNIKASLTRKVGPLPVWAWALISAVVLYVGYRYFKGKGTTSASSPSSLVSPSTTSPDTQSAGAGGLSIPDQSTPSVTGSYDFSNLESELQTLNDLIPTLQSADPRTVADPVAGTTTDPTTGDTNTTNNYYTNPVPTTTKNTTTKKSTPTPAKNIGKIAVGATVNVNPVAIASGNAVKAPVKVTKPKAIPAPVAEVKKATTSGGGRAFKAV